MNGKKRQAAILQVVRRSPATVEELGRKFSVSVATVRRDLKALADRGEIARTYGGATALTDGPESNTDERERENWREKQLIAAEAVDMIAPSMMIYLDAGTSVLALARKITLLAAEFHGLVVVTNSYLALAAMDRIEGIDRIMLGGEYRGISRCTLGSAAERMVREMRFDIAFLGADAIDARYGLGETDHRQIALKSLVMQHSDQSVVLVDRSKLGKSGSKFWAELPARTVVISDAPPTAGFEAMDFRVATGA